MRAGFFQFDVKFGDIQASLKRVRRVLRQAEFDLVVLPELFSTGYLLGSRERALQLAETIPGGEATQALIELAAERRGAILAGICERDGDRVYNTAVLVSPDGSVERHRKVHLPRYEVPVFDRGDRFETFDAAGANIGVALCFDLWMPEACRSLALAGAEILASPANFGGPWSMDVARVRAVENACFVISANRTGTEESGGMKVTFRGGSQIVDCDGTVLFQAGKEERLAIVEIDPERAREKRNVFSDDILRELEFYRREESGSGAR
jgi:predicted amidohydrolase